MDNRYYIEEIKDDSCLISGQECVHLTKVRRARINDEIVGFNGDGFDYHLQIKEIGKNSVFCKILEKVENIANVSPKLTVYLASIKSDALNDALDGLTELNVKDIVIFESNYTNIKYDDKKIDKLKNHFIQACKQCERADLPNIRFVDFKTMTNELKRYDLSIFAYENANENFNTLDIASYKDKNVAIIVGGEGGFAEHEVEILDKVAKRVSMGKTILRAKVAVVVLAGAVLSRLGAWER